MPIEQPFALAIETSNTDSARRYHGAVAIVPPEGPATIEPLTPRARHDDDLMPAIQRACARAGARPASIGRVSVSIGPGGFTAVRIAVTTAKLIAEATGAQCCAVPTALALAAAHRAICATRSPLIVALAWKREDVWVQRFPESALLERAPQGAIEKTRGLRIDPGATLIADESLESRWRERNTDHAPVTIARPIFDPLMVHEVSLMLEPVDPLALAPIYPREPEAVSKWREMHPPRA